MAYRKKIYRFKRAIEVEEYHTARYGAPGQARQEKKKLTPEQVEKVNQYNKEKKARRKLRANFQKNDYWVCFSYKRDARPRDMEAAKADFQKAIRHIRKEYAKHGQTLKWMRNIEVGTKGAWHIHLIVNRIPDTDIILRDAWGKGRVTHQLLYEQGEFADLAAYITKTSKTDPRLTEASYSASRNLPIPDPEVRVYRHWKTWNRDRVTRIPAGWYLDKNSLVEGVNRVTGYPYRTYTLLKLDRRC